MRKKPHHPPVPDRAEKERTQRVPPPPRRARDRILVALDVQTLKEADDLVDRLHDVVGGFKIGHQLFTAHGPKAIHHIRGKSGRIFLDLKYHDIPATVAKSAREAARLGAWMMTVHAAGGREMMMRCKEAAFEYAVAHRTPPPIIVAVTVLTSLTQLELIRDLGISRNLDEQVRHLANLAQGAGLDGVVASPNEIRLIRESCGPQFVIVSPGIRPAGAEAHDQKRTAEPAQALSDGADYLVIGRPITGAPDPAAAAEAIVSEIEQHGGQSLQETRHR